MKVPIVKVQYLREAARVQDLKYATAGSAAIDLRTLSDVMVGQGRSTVIYTGIAIEVPVGYAAVILPRSGLGFEFGLGLMNGTGLIDSDYRGEIMIALTLVNPVLNGHLLADDIELDAGTRIAQLAIVPMPQVQFLEATLSSTDRGKGGIGHTGTN